MDLVALQVVNDALVDFRANQWVIEKRGANANRGGAREDELDGD